MLAIAIGLLPVVLFLLGLVWLDSFKLVRFRTVAWTLGAGAVAAAAAFVLNSTLLDVLHWSPRWFSRYVAPFPEETFKAVAILVLLRSNRVGFLVDAAILGFAAGTGFALVENAYYVASLPEARIGVWLIRGFGTAVLHGGTTALFAIVCKSLFDRRPEWGLVASLPGWAAAVALHSLFNHFVISPVTSTMAILLVLPAVVVAVFRRSETALREWLGVGFDADTELLRLIQSGGLSETRVGRYLQSIRESYRGEIVVDMLCYLRLHTELGLRAKGELMMREAGFRNPVEPEVRAKFEEMKYLERSIGPTGRLALLPFLHVRDRTIWHLYGLQDD